MSEHYYIPADDESRMASMGEMLQCSKCKRKIIVMMGINGTVHHTGTTVTCGECMVVADVFRKKYPDIAKQIDKWLGGH